MTTQRSSGILSTIGTVVRTLTTDGYQGYPLSQEERLAAAGMRWEVRNADPAYEQALAAQQQAALLFLRQQREVACA
jgi:hypothetical protein